MSTPIDPTHWPPGTHVIYQQADGTLIRARTHCKPWQQYGHGEPWLVKLDGPGFEGQWGGGYPLSDMTLASKVDP